MKPPVEAPQVERPPARRRRRRSARGRRRASRRPGRRSGAAGRARRSARPAPTRRAALSAGAPPTVTRPAAMSRLGLLPAGGQPSADQLGVEATASQEVRLASWREPSWREPSSPGPSWWRPSWPAPSSPPPWPRAPPRLAAFLAGAVAAPNSPAMRASNRSRSSLLTRPRPVICERTSLRTVSSSFSLFLRLRSIRSLTASRAWSACTSPALHQVLHQRLRPGLGESGELQSGIEVSLEDIVLRHGREPTGRDALLAKVRTSVGPA